MGLSRDKTGNTNQKANAASFVCYRLTHNRSCQKRDSSVFKEHSFRKAQTDEWKDLAPLAQLRVNVSDVELRACHRVIIPDCDLFEFCQSYREAVATPSIQDEGLRSVLKQIVGMEEMKTLAIALERLIVAKPHSAVVERLISRYNVLKSPARSRLNTDTFHYYIFIGFNLPPLASYDARPAVRYWLADKKRRASASSKYKTQKWFNDVFSENSVGDDEIGILELSEECRQGGVRLKPSFG